MELTPLHIAALNGYKDIVQALVDNGADVNAVDEAGEKPLGLVIKQGHKEVAELLRQHGAKN